MSGAAGWSSDGVHTNHRQSAADGGVPCIRGLRIPVATVVGLVAEGDTERKILDAYPDLTSEDIREALRFALGKADP